MPVDLTYYDRYLPHRLPAGHAFFITFRLAGSLPLEVVQRLQEEHELLQTEAAQRRAEGRPDQQYRRQRWWFGRYDACLDAAAGGPAYLTEAGSGALLMNAMYFYHQRKAYDLRAFCIMPNHVHLVVVLADLAPPLARTLQQLKSYTARHLNQRRHASGRVWQPESYDHRVRNPAEMQRILAYVVHNPVKAGLVTDWQQWPYTYLAEE